MDLLRRIDWFLRLSYMQLAAEEDLGADHEITKYFKELARKARVLTVEDGEVCDDYARKDGDA